MNTVTRSYSIPDLEEHNCKWKTQEYGYEDEDDEFYVVGDRVYVDGYRPASVAYFGEVQFASGDYVGVVLDSQTGDHTGKVHGREYFQCAPFHGLFVRPYRVSRIPDMRNKSSSNSSRIMSPLSTYQQQSEVRNVKSPGSSTVDSYFYDDDYRTPTMTSLEQRLRSIQQKHSALDRGSAPSSRALESNRPAKGGILKNTTHSRPDSAISSISNRVNERSRPESVSPSRSNVAFNFRPQRIPLEEYSEKNCINRNPARHRNNSRIEFSTECREGDQVVIRTDRGGQELTGILRYLGETSFATGEWAGIELDSPKGRNDGCVLGHRYFYCPKDHGLFVPAGRICKVDSSKEEFRTVRSTIKSPPPLINRYSSLSQYLDSESPTTSETTSRETQSSISSIMSPDNITYSYAKSRPYSDAIETSPVPTRSSNSLSSSRLQSNHGYSRDSSPLFSDADIDLQIKKSLQRPTIRQSRVTEISIEPIKPKSVKYTFSSSKYDGDPIARRTVEYS